jgi:hypothetical protein
VRKRVSRRDKIVQSQEESSEDEHGAEIEVTMPVLLSSDDSSEESEEEQQAAPHRSTRENKGQHSNPHHLPCTAVRQATETEVTRL